ncbi:family 2 encapsulin nanocompartment cargo protein polyprenyl transferase [Lentzea roselyniae]|uniref:Family 2 encapsulin nanocompartment cargo protein polyprenyl transferase n=1 Tax=Lentzea roselyniae TaxID=531940 RepID=A0ABP7CLZ8_9PSEU
MTGVNFPIQGRTGNAVLAWTRGLLEPALRASVAQLAEPTRTVCRYHFGWCEADGRPADKAPGKAFRAALTLACARAVGAPPQTAVTAAASVELVHNFTLLHDDIMDGDDTRRHRPAAWSVFGIPAAILAGDALLALAIRDLAAHPSPGASAMAAVLGITLVDLANGQSADIAFESRDLVSLEECLAMASGKTASLLGSACLLGAMVGGASARRAEHLRSFGHHLGLAFQLVDDLLGLQDDPAVLGKPVRADLRSGKKSLPVAAALTSGTDAARRLAALYRSGHRPSEAQMVAAANLIDEAEGTRWAWDETERQVRAALACLRAADPEPHAADQLTALVTLVTGRHH